MLLREQAIIASSQTIMLGDAELTVAERMIELGRTAIKPAFYTQQLKKVYGMPLTDDIQMKTNSDKLLAYLGLRECDARRLNLCAP